MSAVNRLCASFTAPVELMIEAGGQTIQPLLGSHRQRGIDDRVRRMDDEKSEICLAFVKVGGTTVEVCATHVLFGAVFSGTKYTEMHEAY
jgi:hypothetical protein